MILALCTAFVSFCTVTAQSQEKITWVRADLYNDGNDAFVKGDAIPALEKLYAFRELNKQQLESVKGREGEEMSNGLNRAIQALEESLARDVKDSVLYKGRDF
jgi:hypothetical protein